MNDSRKDLLSATTLSVETAIAAAVAGEGVREGRVAESAVEESLGSGGEDPVMGMQPLEEPGMTSAGLGVFGAGRPLEFLPAFLGIGDIPTPVPRLPEGVSEEESVSMGTLSSVLTAYYRTLPECMRGEYVAQVMRFAGEKAGQLIRICSEH